MNLNSLTHKLLLIKICFLSKRFFRKSRFQLHFNFNDLNCRFFRTIFNYYNRFKRFFFFKFIHIIVIVEFDSVFQRNSSDFAVFEFQSKFAVIAFSFKQRRWSRKNLADFKIIFLIKTRKKLMKRKWIIRWKSENRIRKYVLKKRY